MKTITLTNVSKSYGTKKKIKHSVKNLSLAIEQGTVFGFLGPNGAGKTTTMKMLVGLAQPTHGTILIENKPPTDLLTKRKIGFMPEAPSFYLYLTGKEFLEFVAGLFVLPNPEEKIDSVLASVDLTHAADVQIKSYSKGMLQRLGLAQALINDPDILFLDEPLDGLDPLGRAQIKKIILTLKGQNKTIFFNSHILSDVEEICDTVGIIDHGTLIALDTPKNITQGHKDLEDAFVHLVEESRKKAHTH